MKSSAISIGKDSNYNEDAVMAHDNVIAVSDGAGGGGLFADKWAQYLLAKLPTKPINYFISFDQRMRLNVFNRYLYNHLRNLSYKMKILNYS